MSETPRPLEPAEILCHEAEAERHRAEAAKHLAEARKLAAEADEAECDARARRIGLAELEEKNEARINSDDHRRVYRFTSTVNHESVKTCLAKLALWDRLDPECDIEVVFNSPGGSVIDGMALFDTLTAMSKRGGGTHHITTVVRGYAASMAGILLQVGDVRVCGPESYVLIHEISATTGGKIGDIEDTVKFYQCICDRVVNLFVARSGGKISKRTFQQKWRKTDWWLTSDECLKYGFVDEVR